MAHKPSTDKAGSSGALQRGKACLRCRYVEVPCSLVLMLTQRVCLTGSGRWSVLLAIMPFSAIEKWLSLTCLPLFAQKCDGTKPACQQCVRAKKSDCCEYDDGKGKTRTQLLKETIAKLEQRVRQLEGPSASSSSIASGPASVVLFDPHDGPYAGSSPDSFGSPDSSYISAFPGKPLISSDLSSS